MKFGCFSFFSDKSSNRNAKEKLEIDWSNKLEAEEADRRAANRRNEDVDIMFYPGVARNYEKFVEKENFC